MRFTLGYKFFRLAVSPAFLLLLIGLGLWFFKNIDLYIDLDGSDEAIYMSRFIGPELYIHKLMNSPIYSGFYALLHVFIPDRVQLFFTATKLLLMLPAVCGFIFLIRSKVHPALAFSFCVLGMVSYMNISAWPRINHLYVGLISICLLFCGNSSAPIFLLRASVFLAMATFLRPESAGAAVLAVLAGFGLFLLKNPNFKESLDNKQVWMPVLATILILAYSQKSILKNERDRIAFVQHYALTKHNAGLTGIGDPWINSTVIFKEDFSKSMSVVNAIKENPGAVFRHVKLNARHLMDYLAFFPGDLIVGSNIWKLSLRWRNILGISFLLGLLVMAWGGPKEESIQKPSHLGQYLVFGVISIPLLAICFLFHPREHYLLPIFWFCIFALCLYFSSYTSPTYSWISAVVIILIFCIKRPSFERNSSMEPSKRKNLAVVEELRERGFTKGGIIGTAAYYQVFLSPEIKEVRPYLLEMPLPQFLKWNNVKCIVVNRGLKVRSYSDTSLERLIQFPERFGYKSVKPKKGGYRLLLSDLSFK